MENSWLIKFEDYIKDSIVNGKMAKFFFTPLTLFAIGFKVYDLASLCAFATIIFFVVYIKNKVSEPEKYTEQRVDPIPRISRADICNAIESKNCNIIISGNSGVGKSILINDILKKLKINGTFANIYSYDTYGRQKASQREAVHELRDIKDNMNGQKSILFVFDQFEKIFLLDKKDSKNLLAVLCEIIYKCSENDCNWKYVLIIRKEWFLDLIFFKDKNLCFKNIHVLSGINMSLTEGRDFRDLIRNILEVDSGKTHKRLINLLIKDCLRERKFEDYHTMSCNNFASNIILPIEAITIAKGLVFVRQNQEEPISCEEYGNELGGKRGIMRRFFEAHLQSYMAEQRKKNATNQATVKSKRVAFSDHNAKRVLFSLCVRPESKRVLSVDDICSLSNLTKKEVNKVLDYFVKKELLTKVDNFHFDWSHDFYAAQFNEYASSSASMDSTDRDNISFFWNQLRNNQPINAGVNNSEKRKGDEWGLLLFILSFILLWGRVLSPLFEHLLSPIINLGSRFQPLYPVESLYPFKLSKSITVDISFIPIAISLTGWSWHVSSLFRRILSRLNEKGWSRYYSYTLPFLLCVVFILLSVLYPKLWIIFVSIGGLAVGYKYIQIALSMRPGILNMQGWFGGVGIRSCVGSYISIVAGFFYAGMFPPFSFLSNPSPSVLAKVSFVIMFCMVGWIWSVSNHIKESLVPIKLGTFKRYSKFNQ